MYYRAGTSYSDSSKTPAKFTNLTYLYGQQQTIQIYPIFLYSLHKLQGHQQHRSKRYTNGYIHGILPKGL